MPHVYSAREKVLVSAMVGVVSLFLFQRFVVAPHRSRMEELETVTARKERQLRRIRHILASRKEIEADYARRFANRPGTRPLPGEMGAFLKCIEKGAREKNVRIRDIRPLANEDKNKNPVLSAGFVTESTWPSLLSFLLSLEDQGIVIDKITLTRSTQPPNEIKAQTQLSHQP